MRGPAACVRGTDLEELPYRPPPWSVPRTQYTRHLPSPSRVRGTDLEQLPYRPAPWSVPRTRYTRQFAQTRAWPSPVRGTGQRMAGCPKIGLTSATHGISVRGTDLEQLPYRPPSWSVPRTR